MILFAPNLLHLITSIEIPLENYRVLHSTHNGLFPMQMILLHHPSSLLYIRVTYHSVILHWFIFFFSVIPTNNALCYPKNNSYLIHTHHHKTLYSNHNRKTQFLLWKSLRMWLPIKHKCGVIILLFKDGVFKFCVFFFSAIFDIVVLGFFVYFYGLILQFWQLSM